MLSQLAQYWWAVALRGVLAILFGILLFAWPGLGLGILVFLFGAYALVDGVFTLAWAILHAREMSHRWAPLLEGIIGIAAGIVTFAWPGVTALALLYIIAFWAVVTGVMEIVAAIRLRRVIDNEWWLIIAGALSVLFGLFLLVAPGAGALAVVTIIGIYSVVFGIFLIGLSLRLRGLSHQHVGMPAPMPT